MIMVQNADIVKYTGDIKTILKHNISYNHISHVDGDVSVKRIETWTTTNKYVGLLKGNLTNSISIKRPLPCVSNYCEHGIH